MMFKMTKFKSVAERDKALMIWIDKATIKELKKLIKTEPIYYIPAYYKIKERLKE